MTPTPSSPAQDPTIAELIDRFVSTRQGANCSQDTIIFYRTRLRLCLQALSDRPLSSLSLNDVRDALSVSGDGKSAATANGYTRAVKALFNWADKEELPVQFRVDRIQKVREPEKAPPVLSSDQLERLFAKPDTSTFGGLRDKTMMMLMMDTGMRVGEVIGVTMNDIDGARVRVLGKGNKERFCFVSDLVLPSLVRYMDERKRAGEMMAWESQHLLVTQEGHPLSRKRAHEIVSDYGKAAGIEGVRVSPHTFRSTFATHFLHDPDGDIMSRRETLGHTSLAMSQHDAKFTGKLAEKSRNITPAADLKSAPAASGAGPKAKPQPAKGKRLRIGATLSELHGTAA